MILVTGGAGFIGSNVVAALCERGFRVAVCDRLGSADKWRNLAKADLADLIDPQQLDTWLEGHRSLEAIIHLGAISSTTERDADLIFEVNVRLSTRLWNWCAAHHTPFLYASSAATYGSGERGFDDDQRREALALLKPLNPYGWSKHFFDLRVTRAVAEGAAAPPQWVGLKFFNVYGPNEYHKGTMQSVVSQKYPLVSHGQPATLFASHRPDYPDGGQKRDFVFVEDCVDVILWLLGKPGVSGLFNLGSGRACSFADVASSLAAAACVPCLIEFVPMPEEIRPNYQYFTEARMHKLREAGYDRPFTPMEDGVRHYIQKYLAGPDRYR